jgi:hypothetical protein
VRGVDWRTIAAFDVAVAVLTVCVVLFSATESSGNVVATITSPFWFAV